MLFLTEYRFRRHMPKSDIKRLMDLFGSRGPEDGTIANYVKADGSGGVIVGDQDDVAKAYEGVLAYVEFMEFTVTPALTVDDAVGPILRSLEEG